MAFNTFVATKLRVMVYVKTDVWTICYRKGKARVSI